MQTLEPTPAARGVRPLSSYQPSPRVIWTDRVARWLIRLFGVSVILAVILILVFVGKEAAPLFYQPSARALPPLLEPALGAHASLLTWSVDEFQRYSYGLANDGHFYFISNKDGRVAHDLAVAGLATNTPAVAWCSPKGDLIASATRDGSVLVAGVHFKMDYDPAGDMILTPALKESPLLGLPRELVPKGGFECERLTASHNAATETLSLAMMGRDGRLLAGTFHIPSGTLELAEVQGGPEGRVSAMGIDADARFLLLATDANSLCRWDLTASREKPAQVTSPSTSGSHVTAIAPLIGSFTWILGFADGGVEAWFGVRPGPDIAGSRLQKIRGFERHPAAVAGITPSGVDRGFWTWDTSGRVKLHFNPSARKMFTLDAGGAVAGVAPNGHLNGVSVLTREGAILQWELDNPHPDVTLGALFGKMWYEGYSKPDYVWQSSSGADAFEAKFSMVPLAIGTLKGAFFGLLFAIPLSVLAAIYTSQLMHPRIRSVVKPTLEIMAALPSVVIGFLAGLWIAPFLEKHLVAFGLVVPLFLIFLVVASRLYHRIPLRRRNHFPPELELGIMMGVVALAMTAATLLASPVENFFFHGNIQQWIYDTTGSKVEQRNSIVIGLAMGFAVIPIIFSISEDALSNVPRHYVSGSLALGATRWQSALRVVVPTASPGIFSAVMLGFGRAVGETMIVLMATGNTPVLTFNPFNGMRTLSANIAVEIPEAPHGGSLYRILFLAALLLFALTFIVNTAAEVVRMRLREKYRAL